MIEPHFIITTRQTRSSLNIRLIPYFCYWYTWKLVENSNQLSSWQGFVVKFFRNFTPLLVQDSISSFFELKSSVLLWYGPLSVLSKQLHWRKFRVVFKYTRSFLKRVNIRVSDFVLRPPANVMILSVQKEEKISHNHYFFSKCCKINMLLG